MGVQLGLRRTENRDQNKPGEKLNPSGGPALHDIHIPIGLVSPAHELRIGQRTFVKGETGRRMPFPMITPRLVTGSFKSHPQYDGAVGSVEPNGESDGRVGCRYYG